jgi:two-component system LytT family response regulator
MRELSYSITTNDYQFAGNINTLLFELFYELRKDIWSFCFFVVMIAVYRYLISQWLGDAISLTENINSDNKLSTTDTLANLLLVRKLGKEFLVKTKDIECIEASGNYANLHMKNQVYPMRITMTDFIKKGDCFGFVRTHKSFAVNINFIDFIENQPSSDAEIVMQSGKRIRLSRRYKNDFEASIANI